ncbi:MAG: imidazole glycerol phosphate synthase subunit HisH [Gammaproteobacteria bacterium]|jgi:glutamine amidotransferase|nr:imidazole glycerol phosphate synthase subunit HisH [Gammaproteobacteria bacterium]
MNTIAVIDYGMGNLHSVAKALEHVAPQARVLVTNDPQTIADSDRVVLPGVGAIRDCIGEIRRLGVDKIVADTLGSKPMLGICVGMQALMQHSSENGGVDCLGHLSGEVAFFADQPSVTDTHLKVPHMGWNQVQQIDHPLWSGIDNHSRFYFVHSYYVRTEARHLVAGTCHYGVDFDVALAQPNLFAVQFHPEKSHTAGLQLLKNFVHWDGN